MQLNLDNFDKSIVVPFSTIDWPGKASMVVFLRGCNFKCNYCQNYRIWGASQPNNSDALLREIKRNKDYISAIVFSGGEPTLHLNLLQSLAQTAKKEGLLVGIETNGSLPEVLTTLIADELLDGLFVDIKAPLSNPHKYAQIIGAVKANTCINNIKRTIDIGREALAAHKLQEFELRTTLFKGLFRPDEVIEMVNDFTTVPYALQQGRTEMFAQTDLTMLTRDEIAKLAVQCRRPLRIRTLEKGDEGIT
ncbi:MAG: anaerobic ribonucleoside-triphosphate reductase activating protein [Euryarchaeota archaeon]|nr:anaerobic ribonucleoside-triphosphate reductase activating protein [Euryarchaeota archaeon]